MIRHFFIFIVFSLFYNFVFASSGNDLSTNLNAVRTMRANFRQISLDNHGKVQQPTSGRMALERPGKFRWDVRKPIPQLIIANQNRLWIYDADLQQVTIKKLQKAAGATPALLLSDKNAFLENDFNINTEGSSEGNQWFVLKPKQKNAMYAMIKIKFANKQIHEMQFIDQLGNTTKIKFEQIETNNSLPSSLFTFKAPSKVDVIDETHKK